MPLRVDDHLFDNCLDPVSLEETLASEVEKDWDVEGKVD